MRRFFAALTLTTAMSAGVSVPAHADVAFNLSIGAPNAYAMGLGNYYGVPQDRVLQIQQRGIPYSDLATVLYIASLAHVDPFLVSDLRMSGMSWMDVSHYYGLGADVYYVDATPYGPYTSYYQPFLTHPRSTWATLTLGDAAVVNLTNLLYSSQYYGVQPVQVMRYRARGDDFLTINRTFFRERGYLPSQPVRRAWARPMTLPDRFRAEARAVELRRNVRAGRTEVVREQTREQARINERVRTREQVRINERTRVKEQVAERNRRADERAKMNQHVARANERAAAGRQAKKAQARKQAAQNERVQERARVQKREAGRAREREVSRQSSARTQREMASRRQMRAQEMARSRHQMSAQHASRNTRQMRSVRRTQEVRAQRQSPQHQGGRGKHQK